MQDGHGIPVETILLLLQSPCRRSRSCEFTRDVDAEGTLCGADMQPVAVISGHMMLM